MADPLSLGIGNGWLALTATGGITVLGIATGLDPALIVVGLAGGWWALSLRTVPLSGAQRWTVAILSALISAWASPLISTLMAAYAEARIDWWPSEAGRMALRFPMALAFGFLGHSHIGPWLISIFQRRAREGERT